MNDSELDYILAALSGKFGYLIQFTAWQSAIRCVMVFINSKIQEFMAQALPAEQAWVSHMLNSWPYRLTNFLLNALVSVKLPTARMKGDTAFISRNPTTGTGNGGTGVASSPVPPASEPSTKT